MDNILEINDLNFEYNDKIIFDNLNLKIKKNTFTTIIGQNDCGKTTLCKILLGILKAESDIMINKIRLNPNNIKKIRKNIGYVPSFTGGFIMMDTVYDEIVSAVPNYKKSDLEQLLKEFDFEGLLTKNPKNLSGGEQQVMYIISILLKHPKIIIFNKSFNMVDNLTKDKLLKFLKKMTKEQNITIINFTNDTEDVVYGDYIAIMADKKIIINERKEILLNDEKLFKKLNLQLPFMAQLSKKLSYYNLLNNVELDMNKMVNKIWK